jgi:oligoribonuclease
MLAKLIKAHCEPGKAVLAGNTIHQDRLFLRKYFPSTEALLHYRMIDVSSLKELVRRWYGADKVFAKSSNHTAKEDIRTSIAELAYYRSHCMTESWAT